MPGSLSIRRRVPEWMDEPDLDPAMHRDALRGLQRINLASATVPAIWAPIWASLTGLAARRQGASLSLLDVACGGGDVALGVARRARRKGVRMNIEGCDISHIAIAHASDRARRAGIDIRFFEHDVLATQFDGTYDVVVCSLFLHHLDETQAVRLLRSMAAAARSLVVISDLDRSRLGLVLAWAGTQLLSRSPVVHADGVRSVRAAFTPAEVAAVAARAGLHSYRLTRHWPCRWRLVSEKAAA